ncbi:hypothetical protein JAAARDRAFT_552661 [Jaapia argillacea MUCL 33604]|uniref:Uncharacterized protein n=1 Tax=Jaapia argillacea MUCL 33604 TaxID=933084 RepID=A0A067Q0E7_9AGAM|nr:hypothetical protein JAAARDRAFT_552661 [Jaapia argillacea MUCL 33604]
MPESQNSLGLDFKDLKIQDSVNHVPEGEMSPQAAPTNQATNEQEPENPPQESPLKPDADLAKGEPKEKKKPYVNPDRVKTGGAQRDKLSEEELAERMNRIREQNEKIKQRRIDVQADEEAFKKTQEAERAKLAQSRKVQEHINRTREQNAQRKMDKIQSREWDSGKKTNEWKHAKPAGEESSTQSPTRANRGTPRGGGRGGGSTRGPKSPTRQAIETSGDHAATLDPVTTPPPAAS